VGATLVGNTAAAADLIQILDRGDPLPDEPLEVLCPGAAFSTGPRADRQVCNCHKITEARLHEAIDAGAGTVEALCAATKAGTGCGSCKSELAQILSAHAPPADKVAAAN
jgi:nitrite reductase (NADH) large subunit